MIRPFVCMCVYTCICVYVRVCLYFNDIRFFYGQHDPKRIQIQQKQQKQTKYRFDCVTMAMIDLCLVPWAIVPCFCVPCFVGMRLFVVDTHTHT